MLPLGPRDIKVGSYERCVRLAAWLICQHWRLFFVGIVRVFGALDIDCDFEMALFCIEVSIPELIDKPSDFKSRVVCEIS